MAKVTNFQKRVNKAKKLNPIICATNGSKNKKLAMGSLSDESRRYHVNIVYAGKDMVRVNGGRNTNATIIYSLYAITCEYADNGNGKLNPMEKCLGNSHSGNRNDVTCYHSMAGIIALVKDKGKTIKLTDDLMKAINLLSLGGKLVKMISTQGDGVMWGVVK